MSIIQPVQRSLLLGLIGLLCCSAAQARLSLTQINNRLTEVEDNVDLVITTIAPPNVEHIELTTRTPSQGSRCILPGHRPFHRINGDGSIAENEFVVPLNAKLRILDVRWRASGNDGSTFPVGGTVALAVTGPSVFNAALTLPYQSAPVVILVPHQRSAGGSENMTSGVHVGTGRVLCGAIDSSGSGVEDAVSASVFATLRGLLIPEGAESD